MEGDFAVLSIDLRVFFVIVDSSNSFMRSMGFPYVSSKSSRAHGSAISRALLSLSASRTLSAAAFRLFADSYAVCSSRNEWWWWSMIFVVSVFVVVSAVVVGFD